MTDIARFLTAIFLIVGIVPSANGSGAKASADWRVDEWFGSFIAHYFGWPSQGP